MTKFGIKRYREREGLRNLVVLWKKTINNERLVVKVTHHFFFLLIIS